MCPRGLHLCVSQMGFRGAKPQQLSNFSEKNSHFNALKMTFRTFLKDWEEPISKNSIAQPFNSSYLLIKAKKRLKAGNCGSFGLNFLSDLAH